MTTLSWLRSLVAGFFDSPQEEQPDVRDEIERELDSLKAVAALAVAQAGRAELELRDALETDAPEPTVRTLMRRLREERARAAGMVANWRERQERAVDDLQRLGEAQRIERLNDERERFRRLVAGSAAVRDPRALDELEDEARAEAARLDVLASLEAGQGLPTDAELDEDQEEVHQEAEKLLTQDISEQLWPGR